MDIRGCLWVGKNSQDTWSYRQRLTSKFRFIACLCRHSHLGKDSWLKGEIIQTQKALISRIASRECLRRLLWEFRALEKETVLRRPRSLFDKFPRYLLSVRLLSIREADLSIIEFTEWLSPQRFLNYFTFYIFIDLIE